jgi:glucokinase
MAGLIPDGGRWIATASEGSQASFAPVDARETAIARILARTGRVTVERVISGPGLLAIDHALAELDGVPSLRTRPAEVAEAALAGDPRAVLALDVFFGALGSAVGDAALVFCATGGVVLAGGILPKLLVPLRASTFRARFEDKAPLAAMMRAIPTRVITRPHIGLIGAAAALGG